MLTVILRYIRDKKITTIIYCVAGIGLLWMYVALYPSMQEQAASFNELLKNYPQGFLDAFGITDLSFDTIENFVGMEHFSIVWPLMAIFFAISLASNSIAREIEKGTLELVLSRPISRVQIFFGRYFAGLMLIMAFTLFSIFAIVPLAEFHQVTYRFANFVTVAIMGFLFVWAVYSIAMMLSSLFSERSRVTMWAGGLLILMYVLNVVAALKENLDVLKYGSFFFYFDYHQALVKNAINIEGVCVFGFVIIIFTVLGAWIFNKRDIAV